MHARAPLSALVGLMFLAAVPAGSAEPGKETVALPPTKARPWLLVDPLKGMGMLQPSGQEVAKAVVMAMLRRYGDSFVALEDEYHNMLKLRRMAGKSFKMPPDIQKAQDLRLATLKWATAHAPYRVKVFFKFDKKAKEYVSSAECHTKDSKEPIHRVEGRGKSYESAVGDLEPRLKTFCAVLDAVAAQRAKGLPP